MTDAMRERQQKPRQVIVSGATGFVGQHLIPLILNNNYSDRPWAKGNNPKTAVFEYLKEIQSQKTIGIDDGPLRFNIDKNKFFFNYYRRHRRHNLLEDHHLLKNHADCCFSVVIDLLKLRHCWEITCCIPRTPSSHQNKADCCIFSNTITVRE